MPGEERKQWTEKWIGTPLGLWGGRHKRLVLRDWESRWKAENRRLGRDSRPVTDREGRGVVQTDTAPTRKVLLLHKDLRKAESSLLVQIRTGRIGLAEFLYSRKVPGFPNGNCRCDGGLETPRHMALFCTIESARRQQLRGPDGRIVGYPLLTGTNLGAKVFTKWIMQSNRLRQFSLAQRLLYNNPLSSE